MIKRKKLVNKNDMERMCRNAGMVPVRRDNIDGHEIFVADGFSASPYQHYYKFGVDPGEFPFGAFATIWFASKGDELLDIGLPLIFDAFHDKGNTLEQKKQMRINKALEEAKKLLRARDGKAA